MPLRTYSTAADWDAKFPPRLPSIMTEPEASVYVWLQPNGSYGDISTRAGPPYHRKVKRLKFSDNPRLWMKHHGNPGDENEYVFARNVVDVITGQLPLDTADRILIVNCESGLLVKGLRLRGYTSTWGLDDNSWLLGAVERRIENIDVVSQNIQNSIVQVRNALTAATGGNTFDWVFDWDLLTNYNDTELQQTPFPGNRRLVDLFDLLLDNSQPDNHIVHILQTEGDPSVVNIHTLTQWATLAPTHRWHSMKQLVSLFPEA